MLQRGNIRLGTLYEYRHYENEQIRDVDEGTMGEIFIIDEKQTFTNTEDLPKEIAPGFVIGPGTSVDMGGSIFKNYNESRDVNVYCLTKSPSKKLMEEFGYDTCIEVFDFTTFITSIIEYFYEKK